ncbi:MAG: C40 family peptidase, partial [Vicinamibacterales bacterium]
SDCPGTADNSKYAMVRMLTVLLAAAAATACATTGATPSPFPRPGAALPAPAAPPPLTTTPPAAGAPGEPTDRPADPAVTNSAGYAVAGAALSFRGTPYRPGGADPKGFDCSGLVYYVFAEYGVKVPRTVAEQYRAGHPVKAQNLEPGDLVFFATVSTGASHVGIAIGGDEFVDAPSGSGAVRVERLTTPYWASRFVGARRIL